MDKEVFTLTSPDGKTMELPVRKGTTGPDVIEIGRLYAEQGVFTYDPGFVSTGSCDSDITFIDGTGDDHSIGLVDVFGFVANENCGALLGQTACLLVLLEIGTLHLVTETQHHFGDARHTGPANANEHASR